MDEEIKRLYNEGKSREQISKLTGVSDRKLKIKFKELGLRKRAPAATQDLIDKVTKLTNGDRPLYREEIAATLDISVHQVSKIVDREPKAKISKENRSKLRARDRAKQIVPTTTERKDEILKLKLEGKKNSDIVEITGVDINKVLVVCREAGAVLTTEQRIANRDRKYTEEQKAEVLRLRKEEKISCEAIEKLTGMKQGSISSICHSAGIFLTPEESFANAQRATFAKYPDYTGNPSHFFVKGSESKQQKSLRVFCEEILGSNLVKKNNWAALDYAMELDIWIPTLSKAIEFDGPRHDQPESVIRDAKKDRLCKERNIDLFRVNYRDYNKKAQVQEVHDKIRIWLTK